MLHIEVSGLEVSWIQGPVDLYYKHTLILRTEYRGGLTGTLWWPRSTRDMILGTELTCSKHASNVGVSLIKAMVDDVMDEGGTMEQHPLVGMVVVGL